MRKLVLLLLFLPLLSVAQKKKITLEDIYKKGTFRSDAVPGFTTSDIDSLFDAKSLKDDSGQAINTSDYELSADKKRILFFNGREYIYRRSSKATVYLYDVASKRIIPINKGKVLHPTFSPDGSKIAYVFENNLYLYDIATGHTTAVTTDGKWNHIINGNCDWVYEEEFEFSRAFDWSANGNYIAYYKFDESKVKEYDITMYNNQYNLQYTYKYPKAGEENSKVEIHIYNVKTAQDVKAQYDTGDIYIPRIKWTQQDNHLVVFWLNRHQNDLKLLLTDAATGEAQPIYEEKNKYFVEINDNWRFLKDGKNFMFTSEMNGYTQLYLYSIDGKKKVQLSTQKYDIDEIDGVDEAARRVYYTLAYPTPMDRNLFVTDFDGKKTMQLSSGTGWHHTDINPSFTQFYDTYSTVNTPPVVTLYDIKKTGAVKNKVVSDNSRLRTLLDQYDIAPASFIKVPNSKGDSLNACILKPSNFDPSKQYPVLFCNYGGPGSQEVANRFGSISYWHQLLAENGFIIIKVDNTGTGFRGEEFKKKTYLQVGKLEIEDQIDAAKYLSTLPYVDKNRIGHWGWSFGGFMSALAITKGSDVFKAAIAVAPVTSWRFYDNIYTERYMRTPQENPKGYDENAPLNYADRIKGKFLLIHGTGDDNVHFQNSMEMVEAMVQNNITFESAYYPNKNHSIRGGNTSYHLWSKMTSWLMTNLKDNTTPISELKKEDKSF